MFISFTNTPIGIICSIGTK